MKTIELLIFGVIIAGTFIGWTAYYENLPSVRIQKGQCYSDDWNMVNGKPVGYIHKVTEADDKVFCTTQGDPKTKSFYGTKICEKRGSRMVKSIVIVECPKWKIGA